MTSPQPPFANDQAEAEHWLGVLKDGPEQEKLPARLGLARIFEKRGMPDEAIELLVTCIKAGHRDPATYEQLARIYTAQNRSELSVRARAEAQKLRMQAQREREAAEAHGQTADAATPPAATPPNRRVGLFYLAAGGMMAVGGFLFAASQEGGGHLILWGLPVAGVAVFLSGLAGLFPRR